MEAVLIDLSNFKIALVQSTDSRAGTPDWNVYFNKATGLIEFITKQELATVDLHWGITTWAQTITVTATAWTFTRSTWDFVADWFIAWRSFAASWYVNGGNNATFVIQTVTATVITVVDNTWLVDEAGGGDEIIASVAEDNPLDETLGIKFEGIYAFENQERRLDEVLRAYNRWTEWSFKFAWAFLFVNSKKPSTTADINIIRWSGWKELAKDDGIDRIYFGNKWLSNIEITSQPYQQLAVGWAPTNFAKLWQIDEAVQVLWNTGNVPSDAWAWDFDTRTYEAVSVRTFQNNYDRKETTTDLAIAELGWYSVWFALNESEHLTTKDYTLADVYGWAQIAPWTWMTLEKLVWADTTATTLSVVAATGKYTRTAWDFVADWFAVWQTITASWFTNWGNNVTKIISAVVALEITVTDNTWLVDETGGWDEQIVSIAQVETWFNETDWNFSWVLNNDAWTPWTLAECVAFLDALAQTDDDIDSWSLTVTNGKRVNTWYGYDATWTKIVSNSWADTLGLFIENIPTADQQGIIFTDDAGNTKSYPFQSQIEALVWALAVADTLAWYQSYFLANYDTASAVIVQDATNTDVKWNVSTDHQSNKIIFAFDYDGDTLWGTAGTDKDAVFICEWDGWVVQAKTVYTLSRTATVTLTASPWVENNA